MSRIVFIMDIEEGHLFPSFGLAHGLKSKGHEIIYVSVLDNEKLITERGFTFYPVLQDIYPRGFRKSYKEINRLALSGNGDSTGIVAPEHAAAILDGSYDSLLSDLNPDLYIISFYLNIDMLLLYYKFGIEPVIFNPILREEAESAAAVCGMVLSKLSLEKLSVLIDLVDERGLQVNSIPELVAPLASFSELIACPGELEIERLTNPHIKYIGASLRTSLDPQDIYALYQVPRDKKIIFSSMGSQAIRHGSLCEVYFERVISVMKDEAFKNMHLILGVGPDFKEEKLYPLPENVTVAGWAPQLDILQVASLAIIHGGLGSIKECIYYGVPMIVLPLGFDQPLNGKRITKQRLGVVGDIASISESELRAHMLYLLNDEQIHDAVKNMQRIFHEQEDNQEGVDAVEKLLQQKIAVAIH